MKDARAALDALREEEKERLRREAEEAERIRQIQVRAKIQLCIIFYFCTYSFGVM